MGINPGWVLLTLIAAWCLAAAVAYEVVWTAGSGRWLVGTPPAGMCGHSASFLAFLCWPLLVLYLFMSWSPVGDMTCGDFLEIFLRISCLPAAWGRAWCRLRLYRRPTTRPRARLQAVFAAKDHMALGMLRAFRERGK